MDTSCKYMSLTPIRSVLLPVGIAAAAFALARPSDAQVVYQWRPFQVCVITGACVTATSACTGPASAGRRCRYCASGLITYECEFDLLENCYDDITNPAVVDCGPMFVGACNGFGTLCANGVLNGQTCSRPDCF